jgi:hypothetical protein
MRALDSGAGKNVMERCLGSSGVGQKSPVEIQQAQEAVELTGGLWRGAVLEMSHSIFERSETLSGHLVTEKGHFGCSEDTLQRVDQDPTLLKLINTSKCAFRASEVTFLCYKVSAEGSRPLEDRVAHLQDCPPPKTASQLRRFLFMLNFYRRFLPHAAASQAPLHDVLSGPRVKGSHPINCTPSYNELAESQDSADEL